MNLHSTEIRVGDGDLVAQMARMREWLDSRHFEPAVFRYQHVDSSVVIQVDFRDRGGGERLRPRIPRQAGSLAAAISALITREARRAAA